MGKNKEDIKDKILEATLDIIAQETISGTRMRSIAEKAGVVQSNLHYYFNTKDELLISLLDKLLDIFQEERSETPTTDDEHPLNRFFQQKKQLIKKKDKIDFVQFDFWLQAIVHPEMKPRMKKFFKVWREEIETDIGSSSKDSGKKNSVEASMVISLLMGASLQYLIDDNSFDLDEYLEVSQKMIENFHKQRE
jgi:TetR/AcrR family transcriptional regulator